MNDGWPALEPPNPVVRVHDGTLGVTLAPSGEWPNETAGTAEIGEEASA
jgi:hypothetical protein